MKTENCLNNCFHTGIYNQRLIDAIVMFLENSVHEYYNSNTPYIMDVADDGELIVWQKNLGVRIDTSNFKKVFVNRIGKMNKWIIRNAKHFGMNPDIILIRNEFLSYRLLDNRASEIADTYRFSQYTKHFDTQIPRKMIECLHKLLKCEKKSKLIEEFGREVLEEVIGKPRNPIETFKAAFCNKIYFEELNKFKNELTKCDQERWDIYKNPVEFGYDEKTYKEKFNLVKIKEEQFEKEFKNKMDELYNNYKEVF